MLNGCGGVNSVYFDGEPCGEPATRPKSGVELYAAKCAQCHGAIGQSTKRGATVESIREAISMNPEMSFLECLTRKEIEAIAEALNLKPNMSLTQKLERIQVF